MKKALAGLLALSLLGTGVFAKSSTIKKADISKIKKAKIAKLEVKKETIEKRIDCIKKAQTRKEIRVCEKKYPLVKRGKKAKKMKKKHNKKK